MKIDNHDVENIEKKINEKKAKRESIHESVKEYERKSSDSNMKKYATVVHKLAKLIDYQEKGATKNIKIESKTKKLRSKQEKLEDYLEFIKKEYEQLKERQAYLQNVQDKEAKHLSELNIKIESNEEDKNHLKMIFTNNGEEESIVIDLTRFPIF